MEIITDTAPNEALTRRIQVTLEEVKSEFEVLLNTPRLIRGLTAKGQYDLHILESNRGIRSTFLGKGENPLTHTEFLLRTQGGWDESAIERHVTAVISNEQQLPWVRKEITADGDETVRILPFGADASGPSVVIRTHGQTGKVSMEVLNPRTMSPAEAVLIGKALTRAAALTAASAMESLDAPFADAA